MTLVLVLTPNTPISLDTVSIAGKTQLPIILGQSGLAVGRGLTPKNPAKLPLLVNS